MAPPQGPSRPGRPLVVLAAIIVILTLSVVYDIAVRFIERRTLVWQTAGRRDTSRPARAALPAQAAA